jgi:photosystem II stability/assembly factor-like uncharacterized protein
MRVALVVSVVLAGCYDVPSLLGLHRSDGGEDGSVGDGGSGVTWSVRAQPNVVLRAVWGTSATDLFAVGDGGVILRSSDGTNWTPVPVAGLIDNLYAIWGTGGSYVYAVGDNSVILRSTDGGAMWSFQRNPTISTPNHAVWGDQIGDVWVASLNGIVYSNNAGLTYGGQTSATGYHAMWGASATSVWAVGHGSGALISHYNGSFWDAQDATGAAGSTLQGVWGSGSNLFAVGTEGYILGTTNTGSSWAPRLGPSISNFNAVWGSSAADVYVVGDGGELLHSVDQGLTWQHEGGGNQALFGVWGSGGDDVYAVGDHVILHRP